MAEETPQPPQINDGDNGDTLPTLAINRFSARVGPQQTRIAFGEIVDFSRPTGWRVALQVTNDDALALARLILDQLGETHPPQPAPQPQKPGGSAMLPGAEAIVNHGKR